MLQLVPPNLVPRSFMAATAGPPRPTVAPWLIPLGPFATGGPRIIPSAWIAVLDLKILRDVAMYICSSHLCDNEDCDSLL